MSGQADGGGGHKTRDDPWMSTVTNVSGFLAGFSLATVVVISDAPEHFRWPGVAALALTIASVVLVLAAQGARRGAYYWEGYNKQWRHRIWVAYHGGIIALLVGLGAALVPLEGMADRPGVAGQPVLRWVAAIIASGAALFEVGVVVKTLVRRRKKRKGLLNGNHDNLSGLLQGREDWRREKRGRRWFWCSGAGGAALLVIAPEVDGFLMYRADEDLSWVISRIESVADWLGWNEAEHARPAAKKVECRQALKRARKQQRMARRALADT